MKAPLAEQRCCPYCGNDEFITSAHVMQDWKVDGYGNFIETEDSCIEVTSGPDTDNIWVCASCGKEYSEKKKE